MSTLIAQNINNFILSNHNVAILKTMHNNHLKFDKQFVRDFWQLVKAYITADEKWGSLALFSLFAMAIGGEILGHVLFNDTYRVFWNALSVYDKPAIIASLVRYSWIVVLFGLCSAGIFYFKESLSIRWRRWLTTHYMAKWLHDHTHYRMHLLNTTVDNPDQRISEDLDKFPDKTLELFHKFFNSLLLLLVFGYILWHLSGNIVIPVGRTQIVIPGIFCWVACFYAIFGTTMISKMGKALSYLDYQQQRFNANFRFGLARLRESGEQVALYGGEIQEHAKFQRFFKPIFGNYINIISLKTYLLFFNKGYSYLAYVIGYAIAMPFYLAKTITLGPVMQISSAFNSVSSGFSVFVEAYNDLAEWRSVIARISEFHRSIAALQALPEAAIKIHPHHDNDIIVANLNLALPDGQSLLQEINMTFSSGRATLLQGISGVGKTTLLRALAGLWPYGSGQIRMPVNVKKLFLPQKPYLPLGSLKEALLYPFNAQVEDKDLHHVLDVCGLSKWLPHLDDVRHWMHELSLGEQQLIAFARIFLHKPDIIFLDEATSALDEVKEAKMYRWLRECLPASTIVSVGHRTGLKAFHEQNIILQTAEF